MKRQSCLLQNAQTSCGAHPASYSLDSGGNCPVGTTAGS